MYIINLQDCSFCHARYRLCCVGLNVWSSVSKLWHVKEDRAFIRRPRQDLKTIKQELKSLNKKYALISGDRHLVEVMEIPELELGTLTYEYTISGVHSAMFPGNLGDPKSNPYRVDGFDGESNYAVLTISNKMNDFNQVHFQAYSLKGEKINRIDSF